MINDFKFNNYTYSTLSAALLAYWDATDEQQQSNITRISDGKVYAVDTAIWKRQ